MDRSPPPSPTETRKRAREDQTHVAENDPPKKHKGEHVTVEVLAIRTDVCVPLPAVIHNVEIQTAKMLAPHLRDPSTFLTGPKGVSATRMRVYKLRVKAPPGSQKEVTRAVEEAMRPHFQVMRPSDAAQTHLCIPWDSPPLLYGDTQPWVLDNFPVPAFLPGGSSAILCGVCISDTCKALITPEGMLNEWPTVACGDISGACCYTCRTDFDKQDD